MRVLSAVFTVFMVVISTMTFSQGSDSGLVDLKPNKTNHSWDRLSVSAGALFAGYASDITLGSEQLGLGLSVDLERLLGLNITTWALTGNAQVRLGKKKRSQFSMSYFEVNRSSKKVLVDDLEIGDIVIPLKTEITTRFNWKIITAKYDYSFYQDDRVSLGVSAGIYALPVKFSIEIVDRKGTSQNLFAPLPIVGFRSDILITKKFYLNQTLDFLYLESNGFTGSILDFDFSVEYRPIKHLGISVGISATKWKLISNGDSYLGVDFFGEMEARFTGLFIKGKFFL